MFKCFFNIQIESINSISILKIHLFISLLIFVIKKLSEWDIINRKKSIDNWENQVNINTSTVCYLLVCINRYNLVNYLRYLKLAIYYLPAFVITKINCIFKH